MTDTTNQNSNQLTDEQLRDRVSAQIREQLNSHSLININATYQTPDGADFQFEGKPLTVKTVIQRTLLGTYPQEEQSSTTKLLRYMWCSELCANEISILEPGVALHIFDLLGAGWPPLVVGQTLQLFMDGQESFKKAVKLKAEQDTKAASKKKISEVQETSELPYPVEDHTSEDFDSAKETY